MQQLLRLTQMQVLNELVVAGDRGKHCLTLDELAEILQSPRRAIVKRMQSLRYSGYIKTVRIGCYAVTPSGGKRHFEGGEITSGPKKGSSVNYRAPNYDSLRHRLWKSLRMLKRGSVSQLLLVAAKPGETNGRDTAWRLLSQLARAGYVTKFSRRIRPGWNCSNGEVIYFLCADTGPICPKETTNKQTGERGLLDRNTGKFFPYQSVVRPKAIKAAS